MYLTEKQLNRYRETIRKATCWIHDNIDSLVAMDDIQGFYKAPYAWCALGDMKMAGVYRKLIADQFLREDGDLRSAPDAKGFYTFPCTIDNQYIYSNGWLIAGMQKLGAYEIVQKSLDFVLKFQDPTHGGFYNTFDTKTKTIGKDLIDSSSTSSAGLACLAAGRMEQARRAGDFLLNLLAIQPEPDRYFFSCMKKDGTLHTDVFGNEDAWASDGRKQKCLSAEADAGGELTWLIGKPTKFLTHLYTATGEEKYLDGAKTAFFFFHKLHENAWTNYASCKTMWAGAELYRQTGESIFADTAIRILDYYCDTQSPSGTWVHKLWYDDSSDQTLAWSADITFEYIAEISDVIFDFCSC